MKIQIIDQTGKASKQIDTKIFESKIRRDIISKIIELGKQGQEYAPFYNAGMQTSASGNVRHLRHAWKSDRGRGQARIPKKRMSDRGERFHWVGAVIPGTKGGRRAHPPKIGGKIGKINKKEAKIGLKSALAMSCSLELLKESYGSLKDKKLEIKCPIILDSKTLSLKTKDFIDLLKKIFGKDAGSLIIRKAKVRAGKGKMRNRKYKKNAGLLMVIGNNEEKKIGNIEVKKVGDIMIKDLSPNGKPRLLVFTEMSIKDLEDKLK